MQKISTMRGTGRRIFSGRQLAIGLDLGDRWSFYCVRDLAEHGLLAVVILNPASSAPRRLHNAIEGNCPT